MNTIEPIRAETWREEDGKHSCPLFRNHPWVTPGGATELDVLPPTHGLAARRRDQDFAPESARLLPLILRSVRLSVQRSTSTGDLDGVPGPETLPI